MSDDATTVWNRACDYDFQPTCEGDRRLKAVVQFDALIQNGGLGHALDVAGPDEVEDAVDALRHFGLPDAARVVEAARAQDDEEVREAMGDQYHAAAPSLDDAFTRYYEEHADDFAAA